MYLIISLYIFHAVAKIVLQPKTKTLHQSIDVSKRLHTAFEEIHSKSPDNLEKEVKNVIETLQSGKCVV